MTATTDAVGDGEAAGSASPTPDAPAPDDAAPDDAAPDAPAPDDEGEPDDERRVRDQRDRRLVRRVRDGDARAFQEIVTIYQHRVFGMMLRMIGNRQEAEDLAQEVFITLHRAIANYRGEGRFYTWLFRIAANTCKNRIKYLRGRNFHRSVPVDEPPDANPEATGGPTTSFSSHTPGPEAMTVGNRLEVAIQRELEALDPEHRLLIVLRDIQGMSYQDILRVTGLQEGTLKSRLHRARLALRDRLKPHMT